jgi:hypothetical protein
MIAEHPSIASDDDPADRQQSQWIVHAAVANGQHVDALSFGDVVARELATAAELMCQMLPPGGPPLGEYILVANPNLVSTVDFTIISQAAPGRTLISQVLRCADTNDWTPGPWTAAATDERFPREWPSV